MKSETNNMFPAPHLCPTFSAALEESMPRDGSEVTDIWADALVNDAVRARASDIHLDPQNDGIRVRFRIDGVLHEIASLPPHRGLHLLRYFKVAANLDPAPALLPEDSHFQIEQRDKPLGIRVSCAPCVFGDKLALRLLRRSSVKHRLTDLGLHDEDHTLIQAWLGDMSGMFLVTGPVGSGKTTTLYALLAELHLADRNIVTIEDPVEYQLEHINQMEVNAKRGLTFERGLRSILRLDPDFILLGEIRDKESAITAMEAATTGRVVLSTMHSRNTAGAITALRSLGVPNYEIAASLAFIVGQRLVRKLCTHCRKQEPPTLPERQWLESLGQVIPEKVWHPGGCEHCGQTGYYDRTGVFELLPVDERAYDLILAGEDEHALRLHMRGTGFRALLHDGLKKAGQGITDLAELTRIGAQSYLERTKKIADKA
ncbi:MAG: GspE/PulE family protein [Chthoniobacter sp.]|nr:GspE/PulE family protein [Chthoniobacter sp.]